MTTSSSRLRLDIKYGPLSVHALDLHIPSAPLEPSADPSYPLVVFVHGGSWRDEDKEDHVDLAKRIAIRTQCCVAVPNYRLSPQEPVTKPEDAVYHPAHARDVLAALNFLGPILEPEPGSESEERTTKALDAPYDPRCIFLIGHSCGAHILSSIFLDSSAVTPELTPPPLLLAAVQGIAVSEGAFDIDLLLESFPNYMDWFIANAFGERPEYRPYNTTTYPLREGGKHIHWFIVHSPNDTLVDIEQAEAFHHHLKSLEAHSKHGDAVLTDWSTITTEHNEMLKTVEYSNLIGNWINSLHFH